MMRPLTTKEWVDNWKTTGEWLETVRAQELRAPNYADGLPLILEMCDWACEHAEAPTRDSGLIEQQRIFNRARNYA